MKNYTTITKILTELITTRPNGFVTVAYGSTNIIIDLPLRIYHTLTSDMLIKPATLEGWVIRIKDGEL
ncbi:hypothetical protein QEJ67_gp04 [Clostridium phage CI55P1]|uniref:hypothetical protein n=1 Tax=Clostridium phage CI55P1 TaxID=2968677 RepID=UPI00243446EB|nr:hypothetical protein QEJ67_gp04 [Clostridium phage CI55P1]WAX11722.1 hypothetical protein CI55P1_00004 [Clostridium phage CI55P1]WAX11739.1 hypothetical protein CI55P2_00003 [Clostridium phage CI55P2]